VTPPRSLFAAVAANRYLGDARIRRVAVAIIVALCLVLTYFPERHRAAASMTPTDPSSLGLSGALGQLGALNSVFGSQAAGEVALRVARSIYVRDIIIRKLDLVKTQGFADYRAADRWLQNNIDIRGQRGGVIEIAMLNTDAKLALAIVTAYTEATRQRLAAIGRRQTEYKRSVLEELVSDTGKQLDRAQAAYDAFRRRTRFAQPSSAIGAIGERIPALQAAIKSKEVQLSATRQFNTDESLAVRQILAELQALRRQLAQAQTINPQEKDSVGMVIEESTRVRELERKLGLVRSLYEGYTRYLEGTSVEDLTQSAVVRILEPPYIDNARQYNLVPLAIGILVLLSALAIEFYGLRPPLGNGRSAS